MLDQFEGDKSASFLVDYGDFRNKPASEWRIDTMIWWNGEKWVCMDSTFENAVRVPIHYVIKQQMMAGGDTKP
ncbi:hypothetical protein [Rhodococcus sp. NPDC004095]